jgi:hypothetical protein
MGIGGFMSFDPSDPIRPWTTDAGLLGGATGIALALLAAATNVEPEWDRVLLLSPMHG